MRAMQFAAAGKPLRLLDRDMGKPDAGQFFLRRWRWMSKT